jgi:hypothetical protein
MWPKVISQLVEILPHVSRLVPMADNFFASRNAAQTANDRANEAALTAMAEGVRGDLGQVTAAHAGLYRQLQDQSGQIAKVAADAFQARIASEGVMDRTAAIEKRLVALDIWVKSGVVLLVIAIALLITLLRTR